MKNTKLELSVAGCLPISIQGLQQKVVPYTPYPVQRNINGELVDIDPCPVLKYRSIISGKDRISIPLEGMYLGVPIQISSIMCLVKSIAQLNPDQIIELSRVPVHKSINFITTKDHKILPYRIDERRLTYTGKTKHESVYLIYRPYLETKLVDFEVTTNEWGQDVTWRITCDEV